MVEDDGGLYHEIVHDLAVVLYPSHRGQLECVKEMDKLEETDFTTKNNAGESLIDVARN